MCRLLLADKQSFDKYDEEHNALKLLDFLEFQLGGHGNGMALIKDKKVIFEAKGKNLDNDTIISVARKTNFDYFLYHTRLASVSNISDERCHFFSNDKSKFLLGMNGTEHGISTLGNAIGITDTEVIFNSIKHLDAKKIIEVLGKFSSVFIGAKNGLPFIVKNNGDLCRYGSGFYASEFPLNVKHEIMLDNFVWQNGKIINKGEARKQVYYSWGGYKNKNKDKKSYAYDYELYEGYELQEEAEDYGEYEEFYEIEELNFDEKLIN